VCASWSPLHRRRWLIDSLLIKVQSPGRAADASSNTAPVLRHGSDGTARRASRAEKSLDGPCAVRRGPQVWGACACTEPACARGAGRGLARAEIMARTSRDVMA